MNKTLLYLWLACILAAVTTYFVVLGGDMRAMAEQAKALSQSNLWLAAACYVLLLSLRGMTFIPSTPLLFAGLTVFPSHFTFGANMLGIFTSSCLVMYSIHRVGIDTELQKVENKHYQRLSKRIQKNGFYAIVLWSFFPFAPTDAIVYASSSMGVSKKKIIAGVLFGEAILMAIYVYGGSALLTRLLA